MLIVEPRMVFIDIVPHSGFCVQSYQQKALPYTTPQSRCPFKKSDHIKAHIPCILIFLKSIFFITLGALEWRKSIKIIIIHHVNVELPSYGGMV